MKRKIIGRLLLAAATAATACLSASAQGFSPATGESVSAMPFIIMGVAVVLLIALAVLTVLSKKKK